MATRKKVAAATAEPKKKKTYNKFHNVRFTDEDGLKWDSEWERKVWLALKEMEASGIIRDLDRQVRLALHGVFVDSDAKFHLKKICVYIADFVYYLADGTYVIADAKSPRTAKEPVFRIKAKLIEFEYNTVMKLFVKGQPIVI